MVKRRRKPRGRRFRRYLLIALGFVVLISLVLGVFNMIPVPPLDGSNILFSLLPLHLVRRMVWLEKYGFLILIVLLYLGLFNRVIMPLVVFLTRILLW